MNADETTALLAMIHKAYPHQRTPDPDVVPLMQRVVSDITFDEAVDALADHKRTPAPFCDPSDLRIIVARRRNALCPDVAILLRDMQHVAVRQGEGRSRLHPVARDVYDAIGGASSIAAMNPYQTQELKRWLRESAAAFDDKTLTGDLPPAAPPYRQITA